MLDWRNVQRIKHCSTNCSFRAWATSPPDLRQENIECQSEIFRTSLGGHPPILDEPFPKKACGVFHLRSICTSESLLDQARKLGLEGLIGKRSGSRYDAGKRSGAWIKVKLHQEQEFVIGGYTAPERSRKYFGALLVGFYESNKLKFAGRVGTGFSEKLLSTLFSELNKIRVDKCPFFNLPATGGNRWDQGLTAAEMRRSHWVKPVIACQIKFTEWTRDDRLRQPVLLGIREDKNAVEVVREKAS